MSRPEVVRKALRTRAAESPPQTVAAGSPQTHSRGGELGGLGALAIPRGVRGSAAS